MEASRQSSAREEVDLNGITAPTARLSFTPQEGGILCWSASLCEYPARIKPIFASPHGGLPRPLSSKSFLQTMTGSGWPSDKGRLTSSRLFKTGEGNQMFALSTTEQ